MKLNCKQSKLIAELNNESKMSIYNLSVLERLILLSLPIESDITTLKIIIDLRKELSFAEEEHAALKMRSYPDGRMEWNVGADPNKAFEIGAKAQEAIAAALIKLNLAKKLTMDHVGLYETFVEPESKPGKPS
jgi:hypothetical protein